MSTAAAKPVCMVTGGSSGIGLATCCRFAREGYQIATCGRKAETLETAVARIQAEGDDVTVLTHVCDVGQTSELLQFVDAVIGGFGRVDVLVNNAGIVHCQPIAEFPLDDMMRSVDVNVTSVFTAVKRVWKTMAKQGGGVVVSVSSMAAIDPFPGLGIYGSGKAWVESFMNAVAREGKSEGIRAYAIRPGAVDTPMLERLFPDFPRSQRLDAADVAELIFRVGGPGFSHASGQTFEIRV